MNRSKGLELPINAIVVVAISVLVLVVIMAMFTSQIGIGTGSLNLEQSYIKACNSLRTAYSCDIKQWDNAKIGKGELVIKSGDKDRQYTLHLICNEKGYDDIACSLNCGCPNP